MNAFWECARRGLPIREVTVETVCLGDDARVRPTRDGWRGFIQLIQFAGSSLLGFLADCLSYALLVTLFNGLGAAAVPLANVLARLGSASLNFTVNRRLVFRDGGSAARAARRYFLLAAGILLLNTLLLWLLTSALRLDRYWAKPLTEAALFALSWLIQKRLVFPGRSLEKESA